MIYASCVARLEAVAGCHGDAVVVLRVPATAAKLGSGFTAGCRAAAVLRRHGL